MKKQEENIKQFMKMGQMILKEFEEIKKKSKQTEKQIPKMTTATPKTQKSTKKNTKSQKNQHIAKDILKDKSKKTKDDNLSEFELEKDDYSGKTLTEIVISGDSKTKKKNRKIIYDTTESEKDKTISFPYVNENNQSIHTTTFMEKLRQKRNVNKEKVIIKIDDDNEDTAILIKHKIDEIEIKTSGINENLSNYEYTF